MGAAPKGAEIEDWGQDRYWGISTSSVEGARLYTASMKLDGPDYQTL